MHGINNNLEKEIETIFPQFIFKCENIDNYVVRDQQEQTPKGVTINTAASMYKMLYNPPFNKKKIPEPWR